DGSDEYYCSGGHDNNNNAVESSKKRRLTFEQVRSLERNFELENKLEPERKMQLAKELGLQPRQVAVWFQNRRARWKTKQLERDYELLSSDYSRLKAEFEATVQEKERLKSEVRSMPSKGDQTSQQEEEEQSTSAADSNSSNSSEILNTDSPRTAVHRYKVLSSGIIAANLEQQLQKSTPSHVIKLEADGNSYQTDDQPSCNYFLSQLDEKAAMQPWWLDWS
ncbi:unnamed protein product, partial [Sphagnum jensenii]